MGGEDDPENWNEIHKQTIGSANKVIKLKGYTSWAVGITVSAISASILNNLGNIHALSTMVKVSCVVILPVILYDIKTSPKSIPGSILKA